MPSASLARSALSAAGASHTGLQRENNEDRFHCDPSRGLFMVIDGVGGHAAGEKAAETALTMIRARLERETGEPRDRIREAIALANNEIVRVGATEPSWQGMACVLTVALVRDGRVTVGHVGDTRLYAFTADGFRKVTHDHSPIGEREDHGEIDEIEAMRHPRRNEIYRDVGSEPREPGDEGFIEIVERPFGDEDALLLCTDGLSDMVASSRLSSILLEHAADPARAAERLIEAANEAGGKDNVTAVVVAGPGFADAAVRRLRAARAAATDSGQPNERPVGGRIRAALTSWPAVLVYGVLGGLAVAAALLLFSGSVAETFLETVRPDGWSRTWRVGAGESSDFATIQEALDRARPGDVVRVEPGNYELPPVLPAGVALVSQRSREAVLRPAERSAARSPGIRVLGGSRLSGFKVQASGGVMASVGPEGGDEAVLDDLEITGASAPAVVFAQGSRGVLRGSFVHDNGGIGVLVAPWALPRISNNVITANGKAPAAAATRPAQPGAPAPRAEPAVAILDGASAVLFGNLVAGNGSDEIAGVAPDKKADVLRDNIVGVPGPQKTAPPATARPRR